MGVHRDFRASVFSGDCTSPDARRLGWGFFAESGLWFGGGFRDCRGFDLSTVGLVSLECKE